MSSIVLTPSEFQTLVLLAEGKSQEEIAADLHVARNTVKSRLAQMYLKLGASNAPHAVSIGWRMGYLR